MYYVYIHTVPNGKKYVGMTKNTKKRWEGYGKRYKSNQGFFNDILRYGWDNISHEIVFTNSKYNEAVEEETKQILKYETTNSNKGYNILEGVYGTKPQQVREKISKSVSDYMTPEKREEIRQRYINNPSQLVLRQRKPVICLDNSKTYQSIAEASRETGLSEKDISKVCNKHKKSTHGTHWEFL